MKDNNKSEGKGIKQYLLPVLITFGVVLVTMIFRGIWPFGSNRIDYFDNMQQVAPLYTHLWDWMHGDASLWFDWYTGLGTNVSMSISAFSMLSPFNILLYLFPRNLILESISVLTIIKMMFMSIAMYVFLNKSFEKLQYGLKTMFSCMYAFCGYVLLYGSCFTPWMDIVALFPLLMLSYNRMMKTGKKTFYILMLALSFIINYYLSAMSLLYIFLISGVYILIMCERKTWKTHAWNLGISTVAGVGLSSFVLIPVVMQLSTSQRGSSGAGIVNQYKGWLSSSLITDGSLAVYQRFMMLYGMSFLIALVIYGLRYYYRTEKRNTAYIGSVCLITLLPMLVQGINLMWHFGSYNGYSLRNGFLIAFTLISAGAYYAERLFYEKAFKKEALLKQVVIAIIICAVYIAAYNLMPQTNEIYAIIFFMAILITMTVVYLRKLFTEKEDFNYKTVIVLIAVEVFLGAYALIGPPKFFEYEDYQVGDYVQYANTAYEALEIQDSATDRIVNPDISLNANYPLILRRGALSSFTAALKGNTQTFAKNWGYSKYFLWLLDSGGTVFTNAMFNVTQAVNVNELDSMLYTKVKEAEGYKLYDTNYNLPFAMAVPYKFKDEDLGGNWISLHNKFYRTLTSDTANLVTSIPYTVKESDTTLEYTAKVSKNSAVYLNIVDVNNKNNDANNSWLISSMHIYVNDEPVLVPTLGDVENTAYFTDYNNNLLYLGIFDNEEIKIRIEYDDPWYLKVSEVSFGQLCMDKMQSLCDLKKDEKCEVSYTNDSLKIVMNGDNKNNYALIPVIYTDNWKITVNGVKAEGNEIAGLFTGVKLYNGENVIEMSFVPKGKKEGILITLSILLVMGICYVINHFKRLRMPKAIEYVALFIYLQAYNFIIVAMFILPVVAFIPALFYQLVLKLMPLF